LPWLAGCSAGSTTAGRPRPSSSTDAADAAAAQRAARLADTLAAAHRSLARHAAGAGGKAEKAAEATHSRLAADHAAHLVALGASAGATPSPMTAAQTLRAERDGALAALADVLRSSPAVAVLLTRIAACRAVHADLLARALRERGSGVAAAPTLTAGDPLDTPGRAALSGLVEAEHAAVFGYGLVVARTSGAGAAQARIAWQWHLDRRDAYAEALGAAGGRVPPSRAAYDLGEADDPAATSATALALAGRMERALLTHLLNALAQLRGSRRTVLARDAVEAARRVERWTGRLPALP